MSAFRSLSTYAGKVPFKHWLLRIARRRCCDYWRKREREKETPLSVMTGTPEAWLDYVSLDCAPQSDLDRLHEKEEAILLARRALGRLNAEDRTLVEGIYFEDLPLKEMAASLDWSLSKTKVRAHRARQKMRAALVSFQDRTRTLEGGI